MLRFLVIKKEFKSVALGILVATTGLFAGSQAQPNSVNRSTSPEIRVCANCQYHEIGEAIKAAPIGSTVFVGPGTYTPGELFVDKDLTMVGEGDPVIDGQNITNLFVIRKVKHFEISGFVIKNTGFSYIRELAGIRTIESKNVKIHHNKILNTTYGVYLENSESCEVYDNTILGQAKDDTSGGNGVHVWYGSAHFIHNNRVEGHRDGIYIEFSKLTRIVENSVINNIRYGLHFMSSSETEYIDNQFTGNGAGVAVMYSRKIKMRHNLFSKSIGASAYGLLMKEVMDSEISENLFADNTVALFMEGSNRSQFGKNRFIKNGLALKIMGDCETNKFNHNDFIENTFDVTTNSDRSWNEFDSNYWSQYSGYDLDKDGVGDVPFRPVSLSSMLLEKIDSSYILMNSILFIVIDEIERTLPTLIPEPLKDTLPAMKPLNLGPWSLHD